VLLDLLPNLIATVFVAGLAASVALRRPPKPLWPILLIYQVFVLIYLIGDAISRVSEEMWVEQLGIALVYSGAIPAAYACWLLTLRYAESQGLPFEWARGPWIWLPGGLSAVAWGVMITNPWHGQFVEPVIGSVNVQQPAGFWLTAASYILPWASFALFLSLTIRAQDTRVRLNALMMATGIHTTLILNFVSFSPRFQAPFNLTVLGLGMTSALFLYGAYYSRLFGLLPVALREILHHDSDGVMLLELDGRWIYSNPAAERMLDGTSTAGNLNGIDLLHTQLRDTDGFAPERALLERTLLVGEVGHQCSTTKLGEMQLGGDTWVDLTSTPLPSRRTRRRVVAYSVRIRDITDLREVTGRLRAAEERQRFESRLARAQRLESLGVLAGGIAHDFNNLLAVVLGNAQLALEELESPEEARQRLMRIHEAARFAAQLSDQLLTSSGRQEPQLESVDLCELTSDMLGLLKDSISSKCQLEAEFDGRVPEVEADATQLSQIVMNLVRNASDAIGNESGVIHLRISLQHLDAQTLARSRGASTLHPGDHVVLEVKDDGPGMDEATEERIFEPFFTTRRQGRGLGLAAVHGIVQAHGGAILLKTSPGQGCCFRIVLPAKPRLRPRIEARAGGLVAHERGEGRVLVVDDEIAVRELSTYCLQRSGFTVTSTGSGEEALEEIERVDEAFDAIVLDLEMPGMGGGETFRRLREAHISSRVVLVSGYSREQAEERFGLSDGAHAFLRKPCEFEELIAAVRSAVER